tara:strand:+ start:73 stop:543 length:471 start_codon:yes stop_codon:yes gene_type:complete
MNSQDYYLTLTTLSKIQEGDKLGFKIYNEQTILIIDKWGYTSSITRKYNGFDRNQSIKLLSEFITKLEKYADMIVRGNLESDAKILINYINPAIQGLEILKNTYDNDSHISGEIAIFVSSLKQFTSNLNEVSLIVESYSELETQNSFSSEKLISND